MSVAHLAIGARDAQATADFLCRTMLWRPIAVPANAPRNVVWIDISAEGNGAQQIHIIQVEDFSVSPFENEFGRHLALFHDGADMAALRIRIREAGGSLIESQRTTPFERFFFREPTNGYLFEIINRDQWSNEK